MLKKEKEGGSSITFAVDVFRNRPKCCLWLLVVRRDKGQLERLGLLLDTAAKLRNLPRNTRPVKDPGSIRRCGIESIGTRS